MIGRPGASSGNGKAANRSFGVDLALLREAREAGLSLRRGTVGNNVMYFETGQGSALSANAHHNVDQQTCEARAYAVARAFDPLLVNSVVGFIGPRIFHHGKEIIRAGLEDHFCKPMNAASAIWKKISRNSRDAHQRLELRRPRSPITPR